MDNVYIINMAKATERWAAISAELERENLQATRVEAVVGSELTKAERADLASPWCAASCTDAMIAIALSHAKCWQLVVSNGDKNAIIMEDDAALALNFKSELSAALADLPDDYDLLYLGCMGCAPVEGSWALRNWFHFLGFSREVDHRWLSNRIYVPKTAVGFHCYMVSNAGARKLLALVNHNVETHIDIQVQLASKNGVISSYAVWPLLAKQRVSLDVKSANASVLHPSLPNLVADQFHIEEGFTLAYLMNCPGGQFAGYKWCCWSSVFFACGVLFGVCTLGRPAVLKLFLALSVLDFMPPYWSLNNFYCMLVHLVLLFSGHLIGGDITHAYRAIGN